MTDLRRIRPSDIPAWARMRHALWPHESGRALARELPKMLRSRRLANWIAWNGAEAVGFAEASLRREYVNGCESSPCVFLEGIWIRPGQRRKGIGRLLLREVEKWGRKLGVKELGSDALLNNGRSHKAHRSWGFELTEKVVYFRKALK